MPDAFRFELRVPFDEHHIPLESKEYARSFKGGNGILPQADRFRNQSSELKGRTLKRESIQRIDTDVLVIGAGGAGIRAARAASETGVDVLVVARSAVAASGATFSPVTQGWGIQALVGNERTERNLGNFYDDIIRVGLGRCDLKLVRILVEESGPRFEDLLDYGIRFKKDARGKFIRVKGCFSDVERAFLTEDFQHLTQCFRAMLKASNIRIIRGQAVNLISLDHTCRGVWILTESEEILQVNAKSTILATGGGGGIFSDNLVGRFETGDGYSLAYNAGAGLTNLEFIQFMLGLKQGETTQFFPLAALTKPGTRLESAGEDILLRHIPDAALRHRAIEDRLTHAPFSCRDMSCLLDIAVANERGAGKRVYFRSDRCKDPIEVLHAAHAFNGGIVIDEEGESTVNSLYAAGEAAAGTHGADRIGGCMMTATQVFGARAGRAAGFRAQKMSKPPPPGPLPDSIQRVRHSKKRSSIDSSILKMQHETERLFSQAVTVLRDVNRLRRCLLKIEQTESALDAYQIRSPRFVLNAKKRTTLMRLITTAAIDRPQSLGAHYRCDFLQQAPPSSPAVHSHPA